MTQSDVLVVLENDNEETIKSIKIPINNSGEMSFKSLSVYFPDAIGLKYPSDPLNGYHLIETTDDGKKFVKPSSGWPSKVCVILKHEESELVQIKNVMTNGFEEIRTTMATKDDLKTVKTDLEAKIAKLATKAELTEAKKELKDDIRAMSPFGLQVAGYLVMVATLFFAAFSAYPVIKSIFT